MTRFYIAGSLAAVGLVLAGISLFNGQLVVALALALAAIYVGLGVLLGIIESLGNPVFQFAAAVIGALGILGVFLYNRAFDVDLQKAYSEAIYTIGSMELQCKPMSSELRNIQEFGIKACAAQGNVDQMSAVVELAKGVHFGPTLSIIDSAVALQNGSTANYCAMAFKAASTLCPSAFLTVSDANRKALYEAAQ